MQGVGVCFYGDDIRCRDIEANEACWSRRVQHEKSVSKQEGKIVSKSVKE